MALMTSSLASFADDYLGGEPGIDLSSVGPETSKIREAVGDPAMASPLIANLCWLTFVRTRTFQDLLREAHLVPENRESWRAYVIRHPIFAGEPRHDLIVFADDYSRESPYTVTSLPLSSELIENGFTEVLRELQPFVAIHPDSYLRGFTLETVQEAFQAQNFGVIITRQPDLLATGLPPTHWPVTRPELSEFSTAGIVARNTEGVLGVTTSLHPLWDSDTGTLRTSIDVAGAPSFIRSIHRGSDSTFAELRSPTPRDLGLSAVRQLHTQPPGSVPRNDEEVSFDGSASDETSTVVVGWSVDLPLQRSTRELNILTDARTAPGDSGAALVTENDFLLGFSVSRTGFDQVPEYSQWRPAEYVLNVHDLHIWNEPRDEFLMRLIRDSEIDTFTIGDDVVRYVLDEGVVDQQSWTEALVGQTFNEVEIGNILGIALEQARIETVADGRDRLDLDSAKRTFDEVVRKRFNCPFPLLLC